VIGSGLVASDCEVESGLEVRDGLVAGDGLLTEGVMGGLVVVVVDDGFVAGGLVVRVEGGGFVACCIAAEGRGAGLDFGFDPNSISKAIKIYIYIT
jgi:hypothetical protein